MKHYTLALTGQPLTKKEAQQIMKQNRRILALPAKEFKLRVHELRFMAVTEK